MPRVVLLVERARISCGGNSAIAQYTMTIAGQIGGRGSSAASMAKPVMYGTAVGACPRPTMSPTNPSSHGRFRIAAIAHPGADDWAVKGKYARQISTNP